jgi:hypothetical protein
MAYNKDYLKDPVHRERHNARRRGKPRPDRPRKYFPPPPFEEHTEAMLEALAQKLGWKRALIPEWIPVQAALELSRYRAWNSLLAPMESGLVAWRRASDGIDARLEVCRDSLLWYLAYRPHRYRSGRTHGGGKICDVGRTPRKETRAQWLDRVTQSA